MVAAISEGMKIIMIVWEFGNLGERTTVDKARQQYKRTIPAYKKKRAHVGYINKKDADFAPLRSSRPGISSRYLLDLWSQTDALRVASEASNDFTEVYLLERKAMKALRYSQPQAAVTCIDAVRLVD